MKYFLAIIFISLFITACKNNAEKQNISSDMEYEKRAFNAIDSTPTFQQPLQPPSGERKDKKPNDIPSLKIDWDMKIIKTANLNAEVKDYVQFSRKLYDRTKQVGGYVSVENQNATEYKIENTVTIKVPVDQFENAVNLLLQDVTKVHEKNISSEDATTEFIDGRSRLEAKKQVRQRYLELLQGAKNMSEILEVQNHINSIQEDIETVYGRLNYLSNVSAMSTIQITYYQVLNPSAAADNDEGFLSKLKSAFANGWYWIGELFIGLIAIWPLLIALLAGAYLFRKKLSSKPISKSA